MRRGGSLASFLGLLILAQLGTFCSFSEPDIEGSPLLPNRYGRERDSGAKQEDEPQNDPNDPPPNNPPPSTPTGDGGATEGGATGPKIAFVSSQIITGNLGGVAGADATCTKLATDAKVGSGGTWKAWISTAGVNAIDRMTANGPWKTVTGKTVADTKADLAAGILKGALDKDEKGATPPAPEDRVWTATGPNGTYVGPDCGGWTGAGSGLVGEAEHANGKWTSLENEACTEVNRVYCFEQ